MPSLILEPGGRSFFIGRTLTSIGHDRENDISLEDPEVGPTHAILKLDAGRFILVDQSRSFPILVNGRKTRKHVLEHGDQVQMGSSQLRFNLWDEPSQSLEITAAEEPASELAAYQRLANFSERLTESDDIDSLLEALMDEVIDLTGANKGFLLLNSGDELKVKTARNINRETIDSSQVHMSDSIVQQVLESRGAVIVSDALNDTLFCASASVVQLRLCSVMCVPLIFGGTLLGVLYGGNDNVVNLFGQATLDILSVFASQASLLMTQILRREQLADDNARLRIELEGSRYGALIGDNESMRKVFTRVEKVAKTNINILIRGETGTGKELIAREIHRRSPRCEGPFVAINCGALPESLMESALFGHRRGAFTGAIDDKVGCFQAANGGTLFLDEIGEMPARLQVKLLRAIQERQVTRVGDSKPRDIDIRLLTATHVNLEKAIEEGAFREDLYYRINVVNIELPALKNRGADVVLLAKHFTQQLAKEYDRRITGLSAGAIRVISQHAWPGNIRELQNRLKKAIVLAEGPQIQGEDLDLTPDTITARVMPLSDAKEDFQRRYIDQVLEMNRGNRTKTARDLGVDPRTIFRHLEKHRNTGHFDET